MRDNYFDLHYDGKKEPDIGDESIAEGTEFAPQSYAQTGADNGVPDPKVATPAPQKETLADGEKGPSIPQNSAMPGETQVKKPAGGGEMGPSIPKGTEISSETWKSAMQALQKSFKEGTEILQMLESCKIVEKTAEQKQQEYMEDVMFEAMFTALEDGPMFEAVTRDDKDDIKKIVRTIRPKVKKDLSGSGVYFYEARVATRVLSTALTAVGASAATAATAILSPLLLIPTAVVGAKTVKKSVGSLFNQIWTTRLWQVVGIVHLEEGNITKKMSDLSETLKDDLGEYKLIHAPAHPTIMDTFHKKFGWKNTKNCYFILVDKKLPNEVKEAIDGLDEAFKAIEEKKGEDGKSDESKPVKESGDNKPDEKDDEKCPKCGKNPCECDKKD